MDRYGDVKFDGRLPDMTGWTEEKKKDFWENSLATALIRERYGGSPLDEGDITPGKSYRTADIGEMRGLKPVDQSHMNVARGQMNASRAQYSQYLEGIKQRAAQKIPELMAQKRMESIAGMGGSPQDQISALSVGGGDIARAQANAAMQESMGGHQESLGGYSSLGGMDLQQSRVESARESAQRQLELRELSARGDSEAGWDRLDLGNRKFVANQRDRDRKYANEKARYAEWLFEQRNKKRPWYEKLAAGFGSGAAAVLGVATGGLSNKVLRIGQNAAYSANPKLKEDMKELGWTDL